MKYKYQLITLMLTGVVVLSSPLMVRAEDKAEAKHSANTSLDASARAMMKPGTEDKVDRLIRDAASTFKKFKSGESKISDSSLAKAKCIAIFPKITSAALAVGGQSGRGVATCRGAENKWSRLAFLDFAGVSVGAQVGVKHTDLVLLFINDKAKETLSHGSITFGGDLSAAFGSKDAEANINTATDVLVYASDNGLFAGASLNGVRVSPDEDLLKNAYSKSDTFSRILATYDTTAQPAVANKLYNILPSN